MANRFSINDYLYYKGEISCPFSDTDIRSTYWELEQTFDTMVGENDILRLEYISLFTYDFPSLLDDVLYGSTALKAYMYDQYRHFGGSREGFTSWLASYLISSK